MLVLQFVTFVLTTNYPYVLISTTLNSYSSPKVLISYSLQPQYSQLSFKHIQFCYLHSPIVIPVIHHFFIPYNRLILFTFQFPYQIRSWHTILFLAQLTCFILCVLLNVHIRIYLSSLSYSTSFSYTYRKIFYFLNVKRKSIVFILLLQFSCHIVSLSLYVLFKIPNQELIVGKMEGVYHQFVYSLFKILVSIVAKFAIQCR